MSRDNSVTRQWLSKYISVPVCLSLLLVSGAHSQSAKGDKPSSLPGGASSLNETFGDWTVTCGSPSGATSCVVSQTQTQQRSGQLVLDIRLNPLPNKDGFEGNLTLPFGLDLAERVTMQVDDEKEVKSLTFKTCLTTGCIVPFSINKAAIEALSKGTSLKMTAVAVNKQNTTFPVSLNGFGVALQRATALIKK